MIYPNDITPLTLTDYPGETAAVLWFGGCNLRCPYCYNRELALGKIKECHLDVMEFLKNRKKLLSGVVLSGGEITLRPLRDLEELCINIKELGYKIKIDTNATGAGSIMYLVAKKLIDYVAIDHKCPKEKNITGVELELPLYEKFEDLVRYMVDTRHCPFEVRTTVHPALLSEDDIVTMIKEVRNMGYDETYYLQAFQDTGDNIGGLKKPDKRFDYDLVLKTCENVEVRGL